MKFEQRKVLLKTAEISWQLGITGSTGEVATISDSDMPFFTQTKNGGIWKNQDGLTVETKFRKKDGLLQGRLSFHNPHPEKLCVEEIRFPFVKIRSFAEGALLTPESMGCLTRLPALPEKKDVKNYIRCGLYQSFRYTALLCGKNSLYFDCRDRSFHNKEYRWYFEEDLLHFVHIHYLPLMDQKEYTQPYFCSMGNFEGDWFESTRIYRKWALKQKWAKNHSGKKKDPLKDIALWLWNRGATHYVIPPAEKMMEKLHLPVGLHWYWWHHNAYDTENPDFWPPREGVEKFTNTVKMLKEKALYTQIYLNARCWDMKGASYAARGGRNEIEITRSNKEFSKIFNRYNNHPLGCICGTSTVFRDKILDQIKKAAESGISGIYLDMIGCSTGTNCYSKNHKHIPGGGTYSITGYRKMLQKIRKKYPFLILSTEECSENYLDLFDSMLVLPAVSGEHMGDPHEYVPVFAAVYHTYSVFYGSYALPDGIPPWDELWPAGDRFPAEEEEDWNKLYPCQFFIEIARNIIWGMQMMVCNVQMKHLKENKYKDICDFICKSAEFYNKNKDILYSGQMEDPGVLECKKTDVEFLVRGVFTRKQDLQTICRKDYPVILHCVWKNPSGAKSLVLANYTPFPQPYRFREITGTMQPRSFLRINLS